MEIKEIIKTFSPHQRILAEVIYCVARWISDERLPMTDLPEEEIYVMLVELVDAKKIPITDLYLHVLGLKKLSAFTEDSIQDLPDMSDLAAFPSVAKYLYERGDPTDGTDKTN